ncbi:chorismate mutase [bacterium]|nr:chorismate mutase [bacterium]
MWKKGKWQEKLNKHRYVIDKVDYKIVDLLAERMQASEKIGEIKAELGLPIYVPEREAEVIRKRQIVGGIYSLDEEFVKILFKLIMDESKKRQRELIEVSERRNYAISA